MSYTIHIQPSKQKLFLYKDGCFFKDYIVSTAKNGIGQNKNSYQTPEGWHKIRAKIGDDLPKDSILIGRRWTKEIFTEDMLSKFPQRDWILTRIMWLSGLEVGKNRFGDVDSMSRYIYMHGVPDAILAQRPASHGCIGMSTADIIDLYETVTPGTKVYIGENFKI